MNCSVNGRPTHCNAVKTDIRSARPGGTPFHHDGSACTGPPRTARRTYGGAVSINQNRRAHPRRPSPRRLCASSNQTRPGPTRMVFHTLSLAGDVTGARCKATGLQPSRNPKTELTARLRRLRRKRCKLWNVTYIVNALGEGGTERSLADLLPGLRDGGVNVRIVTFGAARRRGRATVALAGLRDPHSSGRSAGSESSDRCDT